MINKIATELQMRERNPQTANVIIICQDIEFSPIVCEEYKLQTSSKHKIIAKTYLESR